MDSLWSKCRYFGFFSLLFLCFSLKINPAFAGEKSHPCQLASEGAINIAILYPRSSDGSRHRSGILQACKDFVNENDYYRGKIYLEEIAYLNEKDGVSKLKSIFETRLTSESSEREIHMILGPTESGVYVKSTEVINADPEKGIPVLSPLVVAKVGNEPDGWFFRVNVDLEARSEVIYDFLNKKGFKNISVLFADNTLGQRSQQAFSNLLSEAQKENYFVAAYGDGKEEVRPTLRKILDDRPGAIGVFGQRSDIAYIARKIKGMDDGWSRYSPALFTNIDAAPLNMNDLHFVSLIRPEQRNRIPETKIEEVYGLAYDAAMMTFTLLQQNKLQAATPDLPTKLRSHLVNYLDGPPDPVNRGKYTSMRFDNFDNQADAFVMAFQKGKLDLMGVAYKPGFEWISKCEHWFSNLLRRFGYTPVWNILLVLVTGIIINLVDLTKLYGVPLSYMKRKEFLQLVSVNVSVALAVYLFMSFTGLLRWDDTWGAILAVATYTVFLKAKIFGSEKAKAIGLADFYNRIVKDKHDKIMIAMLHKEGKTINYIAYANTLVYLQKVLYEIYDFTEKDKAKKLKEKLEQDLQAVQGLVDKRKVLANKIHGKLSWAELQEKRLVPYGINEEDIETKLHDPLVMAQVGAEYCSTQFTQSDLETIVRQEFRSIKDKNKGKEKEKDFDEELKNGLTSRAVFETTLLWLYIQHGFDTRRLLKKGYLPEDFEERMKTPSAVARQIDTERRKFERQVVDIGVGLRQFSSRADDSLVTVKSAELTEASMGGARLNLLNCDAKSFKKNMEIEVMTQQEKAALGGVIVYSKKGPNIHTIGIKWNKPLTEITDNSIFLAAAS